MEPVEDHYEPHMWPEDEDDCTPYVPRKIGRPMKAKYRPARPMIRRTC